MYSSHAPFLFFIFKCVNWSIGIVLQSMKKHEKEECLIQSPPPPQAPSPLDKIAHMCTEMDLCESNVDKSLISAVLKVIILLKRTVLLREYITATQL